MIPWRRWASRLPVAAVLVAAGVLFVASANTAAGTDLRAGRHTQLSDLVRDESRRTEELSERVEQLRAEVDARTAALSDPGLDDIQSTLDMLRPLAGLTAVEGAGIRVTLDDAPLPGDGSELPPGTSGDYFVVHQQDVEAVMNALWSAGAEAMMVMDQRIVGTSAVRCVGNVLILHGRTYGPPFTVTAIGDVDAMDRALDDDPDVAIYREFVREFGLGYRVQHVASVVVPAFEGSVELRSARGSAS